MRSMGYEGHSPCFLGTCTLVTEKELQTLTMTKAEGTVVTEVVCKGLLWWNARNQELHQIGRIRAGFVDKVALEQGFEWISWSGAGGEEAEHRRTWIELGSRKCWQHAKARKQAGALKHNLWDERKGGSANHGRDSDLTVQARKIHSGF